MVWMFPGQGSQRVGMAQGFLSLSWARPIVEKAHRIAQRDLTRLMLEGPEEILQNTEHAQPSLFLAGFLAARFLEQEGFQPDIVLGHSLGELTAYTVAGVWTFEEGMEAVVLRGKLMAQANERAPGGMLAVIGASRDTVEDMVQQAPGVLVIANENAPDQIVLSGDHPSITWAQEKLKGKARRLVPLRVSAAFHSPLMEPAAQTFREFLSNLSYRPPRVPIVVNPTGSLLSDPQSLRDSIMDQLVKPVRFTTMMKTVADRKERTFLEIGVGKVLCGLVRRNLKDAQCEAVETPNLPRLLREPPSSV